MSPFWIGFVLGLGIGPLVLIVGVSVYALAGQWKHGQGPIQEC